MKKFFIQFFKISAIILFMLFTSGCWDSRELDSLSIVTGVGIDLDRQSDMINFIAQIGKVRPERAAEQNTSSGSSSSADNSYMILESKNKSISAAIQSLTYKSSRRPFLHHNQVVVFGRSLAQKGIMPYLDVFIRNNQTRMEVRILVSESNAKDILSTNMELENIPAIGLTDMLQYQLDISDTLDIDLLDFISKLIDETTSSLAPFVKVIEENETSRLSLSGLAVFKDDKLVGQLNESETIGYVWAMGNVKGGILNLTTDDGEASLNIYSISSKMKPILHEDGHISMSLQIKGKAKVEEIHGFENMQMDKVFPMLEQCFASEIEKKILECFKIAQQLNTDFYGFGKAIYCRYPKYWGGIKDNWDQIFPTIKLSTDIQANLIDTGKIRDSLSMGKEDGP